MSDTDSDEFYDAQDVTPSRSSTLPSRIKKKGKQCLQSETQGSNEDVTSLSTIEMEKQELLEQKQSIEERLRQEEEEIQKKLLALELKQVKDQEKQEAAKKMLENKQRRKKLEDIRQMMSRDRSPVARTKTSATEHEDKLPHGAATKTDVESSALTAEQQLEEKLEALSFELERSRQCAAMQDSSGSDLSMDSSHYVTASKMKFEDYSLGYMLDGSSIGSSGYSANVSRYSQKSSSLNGNLDKHSCSIQKVTCKHIQNLVAPEPVQPKYSSLPIQLSTYPCKECREVTQIYQEPDIIQSTKSLPWQQPSTSTPKTEVVGDVKSKLHDLTLENSQTPVAPPRKKRSFRSSESLRCDAEIRKSEGSDSSDHLSTECLPSLDLSTAIQGNFHVTATDDVAAKGLEVVDINEPDDNGVPADAISQGAGSTQSEDNMDVPTQTQEKDPDIQTSVSSNSDLHLARVKSKTLGGSTPHMSPAKPAAAKVLTDKEILEQVMVTNLDTGEKLPLSLAEEKVPTTTNPLALHIMKRTKEYSSESPMQKGKDGASKGAKEHGKTVKKISLPKKQRKKIKKFLSKSVRKIKSELKSVKDDVFHTENSSSDEDEFIDERRMIRIKASHSHKGPYDFDLLVPVQNLEEDSNAAVWTMKFSHCGKLLATGGQDNLLRLWVLKSYYSYFTQMRQRYSEAANPDKTQADQWRTDQEESVPGSGLSEDEDQHAPFMNKPFCVYKGHTADLLDLSWSKNYFILSSSMDKTVRLWHVSRSECLCCFQHIDFVTAIAFHPKDDRYFLSGSLDGKLRLWSIPEKKVALWNEVSGQSKLITSANFCSDGKIAVGTYDGRCILYTADHLDYHTQIHVRSTRGKNAKGGKVTGVEPYPGENKILVTSNDSRIRLYDLRDKTLTCKYKGTINSSSRIKAVFNHDGRYIICGSEDGCVYIWKTQHDFYKFYSVRRDRNDFWEGVKAHVAVVTAAIFAPCPDLIIHPQFEYMDSDDKQTPGVRGEVIISADINGAIKVFINKFKPGSG